MEPEAEATARAKRVAAEAGAETRVRVEAKAEVRDRDMGILTEVLNKFEPESNRFKKVVVGAEEETKEKT